MDITQLIADDHTEQRRLFALIEDAGPEEGETIGAVWVRLRALLDTHALAEEKFLYPALLKEGGGADGDSPKDETRDAIKDHNEIRDKAALVVSYKVGSDEWFSAVSAANKANSDHMAEEERQGLADFRRNATASERHELGIQFLRFESEHLAGAGVKPVDRDVEEYVSEND